MYIKKFEAEKEWENLRVEMFKKKPLRVLSSSHKIRKRDLLLIAQSLLARYQFTKRRKYKNLFRELYRRTMKTYFAW
jgi:hypothetical protein